ncbi:hypothetical protein TCAL_17133 [Tigriopus californicus]|uniref:Uncharacterized protein n=1 Tax=Tigriopus californicus TaxID=6832 RepID=A0A553P4L0_TIGCA|nr:hypothetical protein TCAL_17133 [Tigriopus californicus]
MLVNLDMYTPNPAYYSSLNDQGGLLKYVWNNITPNGAGSNSNYNHKNQYNNGQQQQRQQQPRQAGGQQNQNNPHQNLSRSSFRRLG